MTESHEKEEGKARKAAAVLVAPADDDDLESLLIARSPKMRAILEPSRRSLESGKGLKSKEFWAAAKKRPQSKAKAA